MQEQSLSSSFMTIKEVSEYLKIKATTVYTMVESRKIPHFRIGRLIRFERSDVDGWMEEQKQEAIDIKQEARKIIGPLQKRPIQDVGRIVEKAIDEAKGKGYTLGYGKPDRIKGLRKEAEHGSL